LCEAAQVIASRRGFVLINATIVCGARCADLMPAAVSTVARQRLSDRMG